MIKRVTVYANIRRNMIFKVKDNVGKREVGMAEFS